MLLFMLLRIYLLRLDFLVVIVGREVIGEYDVVEVLALLVDLRNSELVHAVLVDRGLLEVLKAPIIGSIYWCVQLIAAFLQVAKRGSLFGACLNLSCSNVLIDLRIQILLFIVLGCVAGAVARLELEVSEGILPSPGTKNVLQILFGTRLHIDICDLNLAGFLVARVDEVCPWRQYIVTHWLRQRII